MSNKFTFALISVIFISGQALAQSYSNLIFFGDSNTDSGRFKYVPFIKGGSTYASQGPYVTNPGLEWSVGLGQKFGVTVTPSVAPGGGNNYAAGGARVTYTPTGSNSWSATDQVAAYLSSVGGKADSSTLYTVYIGVNDLKRDTLGGLGIIVSPQNSPALITLGNQTANLVSQLYMAGARNFLVPNTYSLTSAAAAAAYGIAYGTPIVETSSSRTLYSQTVWNSIANQGINFIPADINSVFNYVLVNAASFGFTNTSSTTPACGAVAAYNCTPANYVTPTADQTYLIADTGGHWTTAMQKIETDYYYGLLVAPGQVSMIANQASISQIAMNNSYLDQAGYSFRANAPKSLGAWVLGGAQQVDMSGSQTNTSSAPYNSAAGMDYQYNQNILLGGFVGYGQSQVNYNTNGNFTQSGTTLGAYSSFRNGATWINGLIAYNWLSNNVNRLTRIGITSFSNVSTVSGSNTSVATQMGYSFDYNKINHGPVVGYAFVNTNVNGFTESGNFNSLQFGSQSINAQVGSVGYQVQAKVGDWLPFVKAIYNSQLGNLDRVLTTSLTTVEAPSYTMPAISYGRNWTNLTAGIGYQIDPETVIRATFTQQLSQQNVNSYGAVVSLSSHF